MARSGGPAQLTAAALLGVALGCGGGGDNRSPAAFDDLAAANEDTPVVVQILANDVDADGDALHVASVTQPANGTVVIEADESVTYTPAADFFGADDFYYTVADTAGASASALVTVTVAPVNDPPGFTPGGDVTVDEDSGPATASAWATDVTDGPGETGQVLVFDVTVDTNPALFAAAPQVDPATGDLTFTPADDAFGSADITITLSDNGGGADTSAPVSRTIHVSAVNDPPSFSPSSDVTVAEDCGPQTVAPWATGISAGPGEIGQLLAFNVTANSNPSLFSVAPEIDPVTGDLTFTPAADAFGSADITVELSDAGGGLDTSAPWVLTITVTGSNDAPVAADDVANTAEDQSVDVAVLANDDDPDSDPLTVSAVTPPANGTATVNADETIAYQPDAGFTGVDSFTYTVSDGAGGFDTAAVRVGVLAALNDPPAAFDDFAATDTDTCIPVLAVLANDTDPNWDTLAVQSFAQPAAGIVTLNDDGTLFYTPPRDGSDLVGGTDTFTYVVHDGRGGVATATVTVTVSVVTGPVEDRKAALIERCHAQMYQIGVAIGRYRADHVLGGEELSPPWLSTLVSDGYLPDARLLVCPLDPSGGAEGGKPDIVGVEQFAELDEGSSYMHEFNMAADCSWDWRSWLTLPPAAWADPDAFIDLDGNPASSKWGEVKTAQMRYGDMFINGPGDYTGYPADFFPILRCFWHTDDPNTSEEVISNLTFVYTIFLSGAMWEETVAPALPP